MSPVEERVIEKHLLSNISPRTLASMSKYYIDFIGFLILLFQSIHGFVFIRNAFLFFDLAVVTIASFVITFIEEI
jgi:hypothetical protein